MTVTVKHSKTNTISDWTQAQLDEQIALGNFPAGTTLANIVLPSDWNNDHTFTGTLDVGNGGTGATTLTGYVKGNGTSALTASTTIPNTDISGLGTISTQNANNVAITGGTINNTSIGATTASTGKFTSVTTPSVTATTTDLTLNAISTGVVNLNTLNGTGLRLSELSGGTVNTGFGIFSGTSSQNTVYTVPYGTFANSNMYIASKGTGTIFLGTNSNNNSVSTTQATIAHTASAVNYVQVTGAATGNRPAISSQGSDTNIGLSFDVKGGPNIFFRSYGGVNNQLKIAGTNASVNNHVISGGAATIAPSLSVEGTDTNISMAFQTKGTGSIGFYTNFQVSTAQQLNITHTASAVNYVQVTGAATTAIPAISAQGSDTDVSLRFNSKGAGTHLFYNGAGAAQFRIGAVSSAANYLRANAAIATASPALVSEGSDPNIDLALTPKGTGLVAFGTYTAGAPTATGYISIKSAAGVTYKVLVST